MLDKEKLKQLGYRGEVHVQGVGGGEEVPSYPPYPIRLIELSRTRYTHVIRTSHFSCEGLACETRRLHATASQLPTIVGHQECIRESMQVHTVVWQLCFN